MPALRKRKNAAPAEVAEGNKEKMVKEELSDGSLVPVVNVGKSKKAKEAKLAVNVEVEMPEKAVVKWEKVDSEVINGSQIGTRTGHHFPGCHVSGAGGVDNAIRNAVEVGAGSFALFLRNQRSWAAKPLDQKTADSFRSECLKHNFPAHLIIPHGSYLVNLGSPSQETRQKSIHTLIEEINRCSMLGLNLFNIHPGSSCGKISQARCIELIADGINQALSVTKGVKVVLENMSKQGHTIGGDFNELKSIIELIDDKSRVGVCIDTCHAMASGYDLSKQEGFDRMMADFETIIGFEWLVALHLNDSKGEAGCHLDRHENIGSGKIGIQGFRRILNSKHLTDIPLILETPFKEGNETYRKEIKILNDLIVKKEEK